MAGGALAGEEPGGAQDQRAGAHRGDVARPAAEPPDLAHERRVRHRLHGAEAARHAEHVAALDLRQVGEARERQPVRFDVLAAHRRRGHLGVGRPHQHLMRAGEIKVGDARIEGEDDAELGHAGLPWT